MTKCKPERGAAAVEFAIILPILMMVLLAIMEFGYAFFIQASVASAARVGVRSYAINYTVPNSQVTATNYAKAGLPAPTDLKTAVFTPACVRDGQTTLTITYRYHSLTGLLDRILGNDITVTGQGSMQCGG